LHEIFTEGWQWANEQNNFISVAIRITVWIQELFFFRIHHYWEIRKVVNGRKSAAHTDSPWQHW